MPWKVDIIESERGWGQRVEETHDFENSRLKAIEFRKEYNKRNNLPEVPDSYTYAGQPYWVD